MALVTFILLLGVSLAACPNGCSSHGTCNIDGSCTCFRQTGLALNGAYFDDFSWTGPDCSLKTCPKDFSFAPYENINEWYTNNDAVEMKITNADKCEKSSKDCENVGVPQKDYVYKLTASEVDPAFLDYGIGGSITCYRETHRRLYYGSFTVLKTGDKLLYAVEDIHADSNVFNINNLGNEPLYCYADYVRKDLSLFIQFGLNPSSKKGQYEVTLQNDVTTLLQGYLANRVGGNPLHVVCVNGRESANKNNLFSIYEFNVTASIGNCKDGSAAVSTVTPYAGCMTLLSDVQSGYNIGDKCFLLESGTSTTNVHRNVKLETSEFYHMTGVDKGNIYFGRKLVGSAIGYYIPNNLAYEDVKNTGSDPTDIPTRTNDETEDPNFATEPETKGTLQVTIDFRYYCGGVNCSKYTQDLSLKSIGEFFQYITPGAHVNVLRLLTTRETEDHQYSPDHACYAHFIQLTIAGVENTDVENGRVTLTFNRPYEFKASSTYNHYAYLFQFNAVGPHTAVECSNQGKCNRATGKCECFDGFEGDSCQRMQCPNSCSQHGRCLPIDELAAGTTQTDLAKTMFGNVRSGKLYGCKCDKNYRGPDCSLRECPSFTDPIGAVNDGGISEEYRDCSGRGTCDYTTGKCSCYDGFTGSACETLVTM